MHTSIHISTNHPPTHAFPLVLQSANWIAIQLLLPENINYVCAKYQVLRWSKANGASEVEQLMKILSVQTQVQTLKPDKDGGGESTPASGPLTSTFVGCVFLPDIMCVNIRTSHKKL